MLLVVMMLERALLVLLTVCVLILPNNGDTEVHYSIYETPQKIQADGYPAEIHHVTTEDGYILEMHRIPHGRQTHDNSPDRPVVFLMHGLMAASNCFILLGPEYSFAYNLADAGFDLWMGNARGNKNSRYHVTLNPDDDRQKFQFFDFTFEEIGVYDVTAMIDYILEYTGREKLHYIGHSQGGTVFLVLGSIRPEYNEKFTSVHLMAGVGYQEYFPNEDLSSIAGMTDIIYNLATSMGIVELYPPNSTEMIPGINLPRSDYCTGNLDTSYVCEAVGVRHILRDDIQENGGLFDDYEAGGAALKQIAHYGQNIRDKKFRRYSRGLFGNLGEYGSVTPPNYDLSLITAKVTMHYSLNDNLLDERDVLAMAKDMPNTEVRKVARESFLHEDYIATYDAKELVTDYIIEAIKIEAGWKGPQLIEADYVNEKEKYESENEVDESGNGENEIITIDSTLNTDSLGPIVAASVTDSASRIFSAMYLIMCTLIVTLQ